MRKIFLTILLGILLIASPVFGIIDLDGTDDFLDCGTSASLRIPSPNGSWSFWINPDDSSNIYVPIALGNKDTNSLRWSIFYLTGEDVQLATYGGNWQTSNSVGTLSPGSWHHVLITYDGTNIRWYLNGALDDTDAFSSGNFPAATTSLKIGIRTGSTKQAFNGQVNEVSLWSAVLTLDDAEKLAKAKNKRMPLQIQPSSLVGYWALDDEEDGSSADGDTFLDLSGTGNTCTGDNGANNTGLTAQAETLLSYP